MITVGLVDDHDVIRDGLAAILESAGDITVGFRGADGGDLVSAVARGIRMDVALVDIRMPRVDGLQATRELQALPGRPAVVVLTTFDDDAYVLEALRAGAVGFLLKRCTRADLVAAVRAAASGDAMLSPEVTMTVIRRMVAAAPADLPQQVPGDLTDRETDVLRAIGEGLTNSEIAARLHLSGSTVKTHVSNVLAKTGSRHRVEAALLAVRTGLASLD